MGGHGKRFVILAVVFLGLLLAGYTDGGIALPTVTTPVTTTTAATTTTTITTTTTATTTATTTTATTTTTTTTTAATTTSTTVTTTTTVLPLATPSVETLDPTYERLLLVNAWHPIEADFQNELVSVEKQYLNGSLNQVDAGMYPYLMALLKDARAQGISLYVRSPYRSYNTQNTLFQNKVKRVINAGTPADQAEAKAAQAVARPGTSEHQTGLAIDFNVASSTFEKSDAYPWMLENAEKYGFVLRYPKGKTDITGIMFESWHWRFVGINAAKEMNERDMVLEEYLLYKEGA